RIDSVRARGPRQVRALRVACDPMAGRHQLPALRDSDVRGVRGDSRRRQPHDAGTGSAEARWADVRDRARQDRHDDGPGCAGVDAVTGALDLYRLDVGSDSPPIVSVCTRNRVEPLLSPAAAGDVLKTRLMRATWQRIGFLAGGGLRIGLEPFDAELHVPYWVGFF